MTDSVTVLHHADKGATMKAQNNKYKTLALLSLTLSFAACQEEQFFQKDMSQLSGPIVDISKTPGDIGSGGSGVIVDGGDTDSGNNGQTEQPTIPEVTNPPEITDGGNNGGDNGGGSEVTTPTEPEIIIPIPPKNCGETAHLEFISRTMFKDQSVAFGASCQSELQLAQCVDGSFEEWSGNFQYSNCSIQAPASCDNIAHGGSQSRIMYSQATVEYGQSCTSQAQTRTCDNGTFTAWSGNFQFDNCIVESPQVKQVVESFTQNSAQQGKVDIVWMVDNSGSMADEQNALAVNFDRFISNFLIEKVDFKMGITTTDIRSSYSGLSRCPFEKLDAKAASNNESLFINDFKNCIKVGTNGYSIEAGLTTSRDFLKRYSLNFLRNDAYLIIVMISDEPEQSRETVENLVGQIKAYKGNSGLLKIYSIVHTNKRDGERYLKASAITGGKTGDIVGNFSEILKEMGDKIVELTSSFALKSIPYDDKIEVTVNGVLVTSGWKIDTESGTLKFDESATPAEGSAITIKYNAKI